MNWGSVSEFAAMGGYGLYVWGAFGVSALVLLAEMISLRARRKGLQMPLPEHAEPGDYHGAPHEA